MTQAIFFLFLVTRESDPAYGQNDYIACMLNGFRDHNGKPIRDVVDYIRNWRGHFPHSEIHVGSDSKIRSGTAKFSVVICLRELGRGVHEIYKVEYQACRDKMDRLWQEVNMAVEVATQLQELGKISVHVDLNSDPKYRSSKLYDASIGFIRGMGFEAIGKPDAWAATSGANKHTQ